MSYSTNPLKGASLAGTAMPAQTFKAIAAEGTIKVIDFSKLTGETVTIGRATLTEGVDFSKGVSNKAAATAISDAMAAATDVKVTADYSTVLVTAVEPGVAVNLLELSTSSTDALVLSDATLLGGEDETQLSDDMIP
jgi:hypothetical protein